MSNFLKPIRTRFRGYQIGFAGASFSYFDDQKFTLIEAIATDTSKPQIQQELRACGRTKIDTLHITSWDQDHCNAQSLDWILTELQPARIETPGYQPHTDNGRECLRKINNYRLAQRRYLKNITIQPITPEYIDSLPMSDDLGYKDIVFHPRKFSGKSNDDSTAKLFRTGSFNVLSLGDLEDPKIANLLRRSKTLKREVDILILAHHGADNGFTTKDLLTDLKPHIAVCSSDFDNKFEHPRQEIRDLLYSLGIPLYTTKTGDFICASINSHKMDFLVTNLKTDSTAVSSEKKFRSKKAVILSKNADTVRNIFHPGFKGIKKS